MQLFSGDKNYLAMLAVPVILFAIMVSTNDFGIDSAQFDDHDIEVNGKNVDRIEKSGSRKSKIARTFSIQTSDTAKKQQSKQRDMKDAIEAVQYDAFLVAISGTPFSDIMTEEAFGVLVEQYQLHKKGYLPTNPLLFSGDVEV